MGMTIAVNGKGGTGKTTVAALFVEHIASRRLGSILAVDADPNYALAEALGVTLGQTMVGVCEECSSKLGEMPAGMTKDRFIELRVQESIVEAQSFDLIAMGRPEGPGCYCYVNSVLRNVLNNVSRHYQYLVIDNAAGMEHVSRRTERVVDRLVLVSDYSAIGIRSSKRIYDLAREIGIKIGKPFLIVNKLSGPMGALQGEVDASGVPLAGTIGYDDELLALSVENRPLRELKSGKVKDAVDEIMKKILEG
jgi:CO dehydrogenase maturation factor